jgi:hypothetical protein
MKRALALAVAGVMAAAPAAAVNVNWIDWQTSSSTNGFTATGVITSGGETIDVTYNNPQGVGFFQNGVTGNLTNYFTGTPSPYTSIGPNGNDNAPPAAEMIALRFQGTQTLTFSQRVANLYLSFVSLNGNGYRFDQDFEILSVTGQNLDGDTSADGAGRFGTGNVVRVDNGDGTYSLNSTGGEPHGTIFFLDEFDSLAWTSLSNEFWNGFTVGVEGTAQQVNPVPLPAGGWLALMGVAALAGLRGTRRR